jgi:hypothetical protein
LSDDPTDRPSGYRELISPAHAGERDEPPPASPRNGTRFLNRTSFAPEWSKRVVKNAINASKSGAISTNQP